MSERRYRFLIEFRGGVAEIWDEMSSWAVGAARSCCPFLLQGMPLERSGQVKLVPLSSVRANADLVARCLTFLSFPDHG
jgi:hypothetical protein